MKIKVHAQIPVLEIDGKDLPIDDPSIIHVNSHWNQGHLVLLQLDDGTEWTLDSRQLADAIRRCTQ